MGDTKTDLVLKTDEEKKGDAEVAATTEKKAAEKGEDQASWIFGMGKEPPAQAA